MVTQLTHSSRTAHKGKIVTHSKVLESEHQSSIPNQRFLTYPDPTQIERFIPYSVSISIIPVLSRKYI